MKYKNVLSIDLESWVHRRLFSFSKRKRKKLDDGYILKATKEILAILEEHNTKTTFFIVTEVYDWYPSLIEEIKERGHEIAYHTHTHTLLKDSSILLKEINKSKDFLEDFKPKGFRAPDVFLKRRFLKILERHEFRYDSSTYGLFSKAKRIDGLWEIPVSLLPFQNSSLSFQKTLTQNTFTSNILTRGIPFGASYVFGLLGRYTSVFIEHAKREGLPVVLYVHPWQLRLPNASIYEPSITDPKRFPSFINRKKAFTTLLKKYEFAPLAKLVEQLEERSSCQERKSIS